MEKHKIIENWTEADLQTIPNEESDEYEYKSSSVSLKDLKKKLSVAASAFWNSGGGIFIVGVDDNGEIDSGIENHVKRQSLRDWVDQILANVEPAGPYTVKTITNNSPDSRIDSGKVVLVVSFGKSVIAPHMAPDKKYYIRAGAHSGPASHFLVEAIRARRGLQKPLLRGVFRRRPDNLDIFELVILTLNNTPALNISLTFEPLPQIYAENASDNFPLKIPVIDNNYPFRMDMFFQKFPSQFGDNPVDLVLEYEDLAGRKFKDRQTIDPDSGSSPVRMGIGNEMKKSLTKIEKEIKGVKEVLKKVLKR